MSPQYVSGSVATQDPELRKKFNGEPEHVVNYFFMVAKELLIMADLGFRTINEMVGRVDALNVQPAVEHWKAKGIDLSTILAPAQQPDNCLGVYAQHAQDHGKMALDNQLIDAAEPALASGEKVSATMEIVNTNRVVGGCCPTGYSPRGTQMQRTTLSIQAKQQRQASLGAWLAGITLG